jgi:hypothetical protein
MKKTIFISIIMSLVATVTVAQTNYYPNTTGTITKSGYTYKYRNHVIQGIEFAIEDRIELYNADNTYLDVAWSYRNGTKMREDEALGRNGGEYYFSNRSLDVLSLQLMVHNLFSKQQQMSLRGTSFMIDVRVDPITGSVTDVFFSGERNRPFINIPVEKYREIELAIKDQLTIIATANGKKFNYIPFVWVQEF